MYDPALTHKVETAIWSRDLSSLATLPMTDPRGWAGSVQADFRQFGSDAKLDYPSKALPACIQVAVVMMIKDEGDIIALNLYWLYFTGIRRFVILDNGSNDTSAQELLRFRQSHDDIELVIVDDPRVGYAQAIRTSGLMRLASTLWPDVRCIVPADADEFLVATAGFQPLLAALEDSDAVTIPKVVHYCSSVQSGVSQSPLLSMTLRSKLFLFPPKVICRASLEIGVSDGNHHATSSFGRPINYDGGLSLGLYYREYQLRSFNHFKLKTKNGGPAVLAAKAAGQFTGGTHWLDWYEIWKNSGEVGLREIFVKHCTAESIPNLIYDSFPGIPSSLD